MFLSCKWTQSPQSLFLWKNFFNKPRKIPPEAALSCTTAEETFLGSVSPSHRCVDKKQGKIYQQQAWLPWGRRSDSERGILSWSNPIPFQRKRLIERGRGKGRRERRKERWRERERKRWREGGSPTRSGPPSCCSGLEVSGLVTQLRQAQHTLMQKGWRLERYLEMCTRVFYYFDFKWPTVYCSTFFFLEFYLKHIGCKIGWNFPFGGCSGRSRWSPQLKQTQNKHLKGFQISHVGVGFSGILHWEISSSPRSLWRQLWHTLEI